MSREVCKTVYTLNELEPEAQQRAIEEMADCNVDYNWWEFVYEDAERIGLKITAFDIDRGSYVEAEPLMDVDEIARAILAEHGPACDTYKLAADWIQNKRQRILAAARAEHEATGNDYMRCHMDYGRGWLTIWYDEDDGGEDDREEFLRALREEYLSMLRNEYYWLTGEEAIRDAIEANEWEFDEHGNLA